MTYSIRSLALAAVVVLLFGVALPAIAADKDEDRKKIDDMAASTLTDLFKKSPHAKELYDQSAGYAVFSNLKLSLFISGGGGHGVAVDKVNGGRSYMKMGTAGLNIGLGVQKYQVVFLFETEKPFNDFVTKGWTAEASANASAGSKGANASAGFANGVAIYQITDKGLMAQFDISGTKYWDAKKLN